MKYNVGDKVMFGDMSGIVIEADARRYYDVLIEWENGDKGWRESSNLSPNYRALYEQEKELHEAAERVINLVITEEIVTLNPNIGKSDEYQHYQQLKQQYNG